MPAGGEQVRDRRVLVARRERRPRRYPRRRPAGSVPGSTSTTSGSSCGADEGRARGARGARGARAGGHRSRGRSGRASCVYLTIRTAALLHGTVSRAARSTGVIAAWRTLAPAGRMSQDSSVITVRPALVSDLSAVEPIYAHYVRNSLATFETTPPDAAWWLARFDAITSAGWPFLVAVEGDEVLGYAYVAQYRPRPAYARTVENSIYVEPGAAGRGVGTALLSALLASAAEAGAREVIAVVATEDTAASQALHARAGFVEAGRLRGVGFKLGRWSDTLLLQLSLPRGRQPAPPHCSDANSRRRRGVPAGHSRGAAGAGRRSRSCGTPRRHGLDRRRRARAATSRRSSSRSRSRRRRHPCTDLAELVGARSARAAPAPTRWPGGRVRGSPRSRPPRRWSSRPCCPTGARTPSGPSSRRPPATSSRAAATCTSSVADDEEGVRILDHLRPWNVGAARPVRQQPVLAGQPHRATRSYRSQVWGRWPTAGPTAPFGDAAGYRAVIDELLRTGAILDEGMVYFDARLSSRYPTVEVRVADVCLDADDAALQAALVRGLAETRHGPTGGAAAHRAAAGRRPGERRAPG